MINMTNKSRFELEAKQLDEAASATGRFRDKKKRKLERKRRKAGRQ